MSQIERSNLDQLFLLLQLKQSHIFQAGSYYSDNALYITAIIGRCVLWRSPNQSRSFCTPGRGWYGRLGTLWHRFGSAFRCGFAESFVVSGWRHFEWCSWKGTQNLYVVFRLDSVELAVRRRIPSCMTLVCRWIGIGLRDDDLVGWVYHARSLIDSRDTFGLSNWWNLCKVRSRSAHIRHKRWSLQEHSSKWHIRTPWRSSYLR